MGALKKDKVGLIVLLKHIQSGKRFVVTNSHFDHNPNVDYVKYAQAFWLLKCIQDFYQLHHLDQNDVPLIVTGDLNSVPNGSSMHLLTGRKYDPAQPNISTNLKFLDDFKNVYKTSPVAKRFFDQIAKNIEDSFPEFSQF